MFSEKVIWILVILYLVFNGIVTTVSSNWWFPIALSIGYLGLSEKSGTSQDCLETEMGLSAEHSESSENPVNLILSSENMAETCV